MLNEDRDSRKLYVVMLATLRNQSLFSVLKDWLEITSQKVSPSLSERRMRVVEWDHKRCFSVSTNSKTYDFPLFPVPRRIAILRIVGEDGLLGEITAYSLELILCGYELRSDRTRLQSSVQESSESFEIFSED
jgi:hypothetical protein